MGPGGQGTYLEKGAGTAESKREGGESVAGPMRTSSMDPVGNMDGHAGHPLSSVQIQGERLGGDWGPYSPFPEKRDQESEHLTSLSCCKDQPSQHLGLWFLKVRKEGSDTNSSCCRCTLWGTGPHRKLLTLALKHCEPKCNSNRTGSGYTFLLTNITFVFIYY